MRRAKRRCLACAKLQLEIKSGHYVPRAAVEGELHDAPRSSGNTGTRSSLYSGGVAAATSTPRRHNSHAQHLRRPYEIICNHCLCSSGTHEETGPNGQRCCGGRRERIWDKVCEYCRGVNGCKAWRNARVSSRGHGGCMRVGEGVLLQALHLPLREQPPAQVGRRANLGGQVSVKIMPYFFCR